MAATVVRKIVGEIVIKDNRATEKLRKFNGSMGKAEKSMGRYSRSATKVEKANGKIARSSNKAKKSVSGLGKGLQGIVGGITVGILASQVNDLVNAASDFAEIQDKFTVVFGGKDSAVFKEASVAIKDLGTNYGFSKKEGTELLANTADILTGFGSTKKQAFDLSLEVQKLASGLASFNNIPVAQASRAITSGLLGEREAMKSLGIVVREEDVKQRLLAKGMSKLKGEALLQAKAAITLEIATSQSKNAIDNFRVTMASNANQAKILKNEWENMRIEIGSKLLPVQLAITKALIKFLPWIKKPIVFIPALTGLLILLAVALHAAVAPLIVIISPFLLIIAVIAAVTIAIAALIQWWDVIAAFYEDWKHLIFLVAGPLVILIEAIKLLVLGFKALWAQRIPIVKFFKDVWSWIKKVTTPLAAFLKGFTAVASISALKDRFGIGGAAVKKEEKAVRTGGAVNIAEKPAKKVNDAFISKDGKVTQISDDDNISVAKGAGGGAGIRIQNIIGQLIIQNEGGDTGGLVKESVMNALDELATELEIESGVV